MDQVSRPMQIALVAVVLFAAVYFVALKPKSNSGGAAAPAATGQPATAPTPASSSASGTAPGVAGLTNAIKKAHGAVDTSQASAQALAAQSAQASGDATTPAATPSIPAAGGTSSTPASGARPTVTTHTHTRARTRAHSRTTVVHGKHGGRAVITHAIPHGGPARAAAAIADHKVLAVLFFNPRASDDRSVRKAFLGLNTHKGRVVLVAAPVSQLAHYTSVTAKVAVTGSPTAIFLDRRGKPRAFVGFLDPTEMANHVSDALAGFKGQ